MHSAMDDHRGNPAAMFRQHVLHELCIVGVRKALVVENDIITFGPARLLVNADPVPGPFAALLHDLPSHICPSTDAFGNNHLLIVVIMAATPGDIESFEGPGIGGETRGETGNGETQHANNRSHSLIQFVDK